MFFAIKIVAAGRAGQDRAEVLPLPNGAIFILADGAGGTSGGAEAADALLANVRTTPPGSIADCVKLLERLDRQLEDVGQTTAVLALVQDGQIVGASVGDSCAWLIGPTDRIELTCNQTRKPLLGSGSAIPVSFGPFELTNYRLIVGSDGLFNYVEHNRIFGLASIEPLESSAVALIEAARLPTGTLQDDIAVIIADLNIVQALK